MPDFPRWRLQYGAFSMDSPAFFTLLFRRLTKLLGRGIFQCPILSLSLIIVCVCVRMGWACCHTHVVLRESPSPLCALEG